MKKTFRRFSCPLLISLVLGGTPAWAASEADELRERQRLNLVSPEEKREQEQMQKAYVERGLNDRLEQARNAIRANPSNWSAYYELSEYAGRLQRFDEAAAAIEHAKTLAPAQEQPGVEKRIKALELQRAKVRLSEAKEQVRATPNDWYAQYQLADISQQFGLFDEADVAIKRAKALAPQHQKADLEKAAKTIEQLREQARSVGTGKNRQ